MDYFHLHGNRVGSRQDLWAWVSVKVPELGFCMFYTEKPRLKQKGYFYVEDHLLFLFSESESKRDVFMADCDWWIWM